jgi:hypothetical protein
MWYVKLLIWAILGTSVFRILSIMYIVSVTKEWPIVTKMNYWGIVVRLLDAGLLLCWSAYCIGILKGL